HEQHVRNRGVVQRGDEGAGGDRHQRGGCETAPPDGAEGADECTQLGSRAVREYPEHCEERPSRALRRETHRELALEDAGGRPGNGRHCHEQTPAPVLRGEVERYGRQSYGRLWLTTSTLFPSGSST